MTDVLDGNHPRDRGADNRLDRCVDYLAALAADLEAADDAARVAFANNLLALAERLVRRTTPPPVDMDEMAALVRATREGA